MTTFAAALLVLGAAVLPESFAWLGQRRGDRVVLPRPPEALAYVAVAALVGLFLLALVIGFAGIREQPPHQSQRIVRQLIVILAVVAALVTFPPLRRGLDRALEALPSVAREIANPPGNDRGAPAAPDQPLGYLVALLVCLGLAGAGVLLLRSVGEGQTEPMGDDESHDLLDEIDAGIDDLGTIEDPREAVIACYRRMQSAATSAGIQRRDSDTPFELLHRLVQRTSVSEESARRLTILFEAAKFSTATIDETMRRDALDSLFEIRSHLGAGV